MAINGQRTSPGSASQVLCPTASRFQRRPSTSSTVQSNIPATQTVKCKSPGASDQGTQLIIRKISWRKAIDARVTMSTMPQQNKELLRRKSFTTGSSVPAALDSMKSHFLRRPSAALPSTQLSRFKDSETTQTLSDSEAKANLSFPAKQRKRIKKNAKKLAENLGLRLNRENSASQTRIGESSIFLKGELYKKRQGLTGLQAKVKARLQNEVDVINKLWPLRYVELKNGVLTYFKMKRLEQSKVYDDNAEPSAIVVPTPRGSIDLKRPGVYLKLSFPDNFDGYELYPTEYQFEVVYNNILKPAEWIAYTFCCKDETQFYTWVMAISHEIYYREKENSEQDLDFVTRPILQSSSSANFAPSLHRNSSENSLFDSPEGRKTRSKSCIPVIDLNPLFNLSAKETDVQSIHALSEKLENEEMESNLVTDIEVDSEDNNDLESMSSAVSSNVYHPKSKRRLSFLRKRKVDFVNLKKPISNYPHPNHPHKIREEETNENERREERMFAVFLHLCISFAIVQMSILFVVYRDPGVDVVFVFMTIASGLLMNSVYSLMGFGTRDLGRLIQFMKDRTLDKSGMDEKKTNAKKELPKSVSPERLEQLQMSNVKRRNKINVRETIPLDESAMHLERFDPFEHDFLNGMSHLDVDSPEGKNQTWQYADHRLVKLRVGPNYKTNKEKADSRSSYYVPVALDLYHSPNGKRIDRVMDHINFPFHKINAKTTQIPEMFKGKVPDLLVVNYQIPQGSMFSFGKSDDPAQSFIQFFTPSNEYIEALKQLADDDQSSELNAARLITDWLVNAEQNVHLKNKLKLYAFVRNLKESGMPGWISKVNGKPCMVTKSCKIVRGKAISPKTGKELHYVELDIDVGGWGMLVKKGVGVMVPNILKGIHWCVTLVIQGETDEQLPERALNAMEFYKVDTTNLPVWPFPNE